jgi:hypothetical protein
MADGDIQVRAVSARPDAVSGGDVLVELIPPEDQEWSAQLNGRDVTTSFRSGSASRRLAHLSDLKAGHNELTIRVRGQTGARLELTNHPSTGPVFSGPQQRPFVCQVALNGLGATKDGKCSAETIVQYYYKSTESIDTSWWLPTVSTGSLARGFKWYDTSGPQPPDVATTQTSDGRTVPYIVRREIGTINRAVYDIQFLHEPGQALPTPWSRSSAWNGRLVYLFDGGCGSGYRQGVFSGAVGASNDPFVSQGYATATSTLNVFGNNCNDRLSAETLSMVKEHFIEQRGEPVHTFGWGDSGGAMQLYLIAQNYPGLLDGIIPYLAYPDALSWATSTLDCALLHRFFESSKATWTEAQKTAVSGWATWRRCVGSVVGKSTALGDAHSCDSAVPSQMIYDRLRNPKGVRCDFFSNLVNVLGQDRSTGWTRRPFDNSGIQYGLVAFNQGQIDAAQFVELNERIGGFDGQGVPVAQRSLADEETIRIAYERGLVVWGGGGLRDVPIIEWRPYGDDLADGHERFRSLATRLRMLAAGGDADNQVIIVYPRYTTLDFARFAASRRWDAVFPERARELVRQMDRWLDNVAADPGAGSLHAKIARNKPAGLSDGCWTTQGDFISEPASVDAAAKCNQLYPAYGDPRIAAGGPLADDVLSCALRPLDPADYHSGLTARQLQRLRAVFPNGVCDYTCPGIGQGRTPRPWQRF